MKSRSFGCSFEIGLPSFDCFCKPRILTDVTISSLHFHKLQQACLVIGGIVIVAGELCTCVCCIPLHEKVCLYFYTKYHQRDV